VSVSSLTLASEPPGTPSPSQTVTLNSTGTATLAISGITITGTNMGDFSQTNTCGASVASGGSCPITVTFTPAAAGSRSATLTITDNASNSPQTVSLSGTGAVPTASLSTTSLTFASQIMVGTPSASMPVTLNNPGGWALAVASIGASAGYSEADNCGTSVSAGGSCTINVTFMPTAVGAVAGTLTITDNSNLVAGTTQTVTLSAAGFEGNSVPVDVNLGPEGNYANGIFTTVTICEPGTTTCQSVNNVLVDTDSAGLRLIANSSNQIGSVTLSPINLGSGNQLNECVEYGDLHYTWGPVAFATVQIGGETASQVPAGSGGTANQGIPIQLITANATAPASVACGNVSNNTVANLLANGILGVGHYPQDCGANCVDSATNRYWLCPSSGICTETTVHLADQVWNPVAAFASTDNNGVMLQLPSIPGPPDVGAATVSGWLVFGIGTQSCSGAPAGECTPNELGSAQVYFIDQHGSFPSTVFNGVTYTLTTDSTYGAYLDSGSNGLFVSDATTLNTTDCVYGGKDIGWYCPNSTLNLSMTLTDNNVVNTPQISLSIANYLNLFSANPSFAAFDNLGGPSGTGPTSDYFDLGLPFFYGRNVFTGIAGTSPPNGTNAPYGYWAF